MPLLEKIHSNRRTVYAILVVIFVIASVVAYFVVKDAVNKTIEEQALSVAEIVAT